MERTAGSRRPHYSKTLDPTVRKQLSAFNDRDAFRAHEGGVDIEHIGDVLGAKKTLAGGGSLFPIGDLVAAYNIVNRNVDWFNGAVGLAEEIELEQDMEGEGIIEFRKRLLTCAAGLCKETGGDLATAGEKLKGHAEDILEDFRPKDMGGLTRDESVDLEEILE